MNFTKLDVILAIIQLVIVIFAAKTGNDSILWVFVLSYNIAVFIKYFQK